MDGEHPERPTDERPAPSDACARAAEAEALRASEGRHRLPVEDHARLREAEKLEAMGRLVRALAHDLNNQLTGILGGAEVLSEALTGDAALLSVVDGIRDSALRSARLTRRLLSFTGKEVADVQPAGAAERGARRPSPSLRVLIVDDEPNVRTTLSVLLRAHGHSAVDCDGGHAAVARYARDWREIDVVILDMMMPDLRGEEVLARLRAVNPQVAVVVASGFGVPAEAGARNPGGRIQFLQKPYTYEELAAALAAASTPRTEAP
jgi:CheY-like chemotaxis protein